MIKFLAVWFLWHVQVPTKRETISERRRTSLFLYNQSIISIASTLTRITCTFLCRHTYWAPITCLAWGQELKTSRRSGQTPSDLLFWERQSKAMIARQGGEAALEACKRCCGGWGEGSRWDPGSENPSPRLCHGRSLGTGGRTGAEESCGSPCWLWRGLGMQALCRKFPGGRWSKIAERVDLGRRRIDLAGG